MAAWTKEKQEIGDRIRAAREQRGWSCSELAVQADLNVQQISRFETGIGYPSFENMVKIASALELPLSAFQPGELDAFDSCSPAEAELLKAFRSISPLKKQKAYESILSMIQLMK